MKREKLVNFPKSKFILIWIAVILIIVFFIGLTYTHSPQKNLPSKGFTIAVDESWYPLNLFNKQEDVLFFSKELMNLIGAKEHLSVRIVQVESENLFGGLDNGEYEGVLSSLLVLEKNAANYAFAAPLVFEENSENYIFSNPYYLIGPVLVVSSSSPIKSLKDLNGKTIGITTGDKPISSIYKNTAIDLVFYDYNDRYKLINDVIDHVIDGMILNAVPAYEYTKSALFKNQLKIVSAPLNREGLRLIAKNTPESKELIDKFNEGLKAIKKSDVYGQLLLKWDLFNPEKP